MEAFINETKIDMMIKVHDFKCFIFQEPCCRAAKYLLPIRCKEGI